MWWLFSCFIIHLTVCRIQFNTIFSLAIHKTSYSHPKSHIITNSLYAQICFEQLCSLTRVQCLLHSSMGSSQLVQHKTVWQLGQQLTPLLCCAVTPYKAPAVFTELLAEMKHSGAKCTHTYLLCSYMHSRADLRCPPLPWGRASQRQDFNVLQQPVSLESHRNFVRDFLGATAKQPGRSEEAESHGSNSDCISTEIKESAWSLLEEYLSLLSSGSWRACFGKLHSKLGCECSWASWFSPY